MLKSTFFLLFILINTLLIGQVRNENIEIIDISEYHIAIKVNDSNNIIEVDQTINFKWLDTSKQVVLDLATLNSEGLGMQVSTLSDGKIALMFDHKNDKLILKDLKANGRNEIMLSLSFSGIPIDGLVIGENKYGNRTFFGDNWPNRAHNWFACVDHPSDKALVSFEVEAPAHYEVIANGKFLGKKEVNTNVTAHEFKSGKPLPTKVIVIGIADFEVKEMVSEGGISVINLVYPENKENGLYDLDLAPEILDYFFSLMGMYEYEKLANVQSTTRYGGMENAGCIFYDENSLTGKRNSESLIAHEIAHQWFGNSASEKEWEDLWLSEGFATYFTNLYIEHKYGIEKFRYQLKVDRSKVISFYKDYPHPVVDLNYSELIELLNPNSYQKGAWVLHMLRRKLGDAIFMEGIKSYYLKYRLSNATTNDFRMVMEEVSGMDLKVFFDQWLYSAGHPNLKTTVVKKKSKLTITIEQIQKEIIFDVPLMIEIELKNGEKIVKELHLNAATQNFEFTFSKKVKSYKFDPNTDLLFEMNNSQVF